MSLHIAAKLAQVVSDAAPRIPVVDSEVAAEVTLESFTMEAGARVRGRLSGGAAGPFDVPLCPPDPRLLSWWDAIGDRPAEAALSWTDTKTKKKIALRHVVSRSGGKLEAQAALGVGCSGFAGKATHIMSDSPTAPPKTVEISILDDLSRHPALDGQTVAVRVRFVDFDRWPPAFPVGGGFLTIQSSAGDDWRGALWGVAGTLRIEGSFAAGSCPPEPPWSGTPR